MPDAEYKGEYSAQIEKACHLYAELGFSTSRIAAQLVRSGYPLDLVRARFPELPPSAFPDPPICRPRDRARGAASQPAPIRELLARAPVAPIIEAIEPTKALATEASAALSAGISFQYVPLIQCSFPHADPHDIAAFTPKSR